MWSGRWRAHRERHGELSAFTFAALDGDATAVCLDDRFYEAKAETHTALRSAFVAAVKTRPDLRVLLGRDADTGVADGDREFSLCGARADGDRASGRGVLHRVVDEIGEDLSHARGI